MAGGRLAKDVQYLQRHIAAQTNGQAKVMEVDDNLKYVLLNVVPNDGLYKGAKLRFKIIFSEDYPDFVPQVLCLDKVYHPNIDPTELMDYIVTTVSNVCVSLLDEWETSMSLDHIVMAILFLLYNPNPDDILSPYFDGEMYPSDIEKKVRKTLRGESIDGEPWPCLLVEGVCEELKPNGDECEAATDKQDSGHCGDITNCTSENTATEQPISVVDTRGQETMPYVSLDPRMAGGRKDSADQGLSDAASISSCDDTNLSEVLMLDTMKHNLQNYAVTDVTWMQSLNDSPVTYVEAADCDNRNSDGKCCSDSLGIGRLFFCSSTSRIKALFPCFQRNRTSQFQTATNNHTDCDVD